MAAIRATSCFRTQAARLNTPIWRAVAYQGIVNVTNVPGYNVVGEGKISGGVDSDIVVQNASGQILYANLVNGSFSNWVSVGNVPGYNVVGVGDINDDHYADIVFQNPTTGAIAYANMD